MTIKIGSGARGQRRPSLRRSIMQDVTGGVERTRIWPSPRGKGRSDKTKRQNELFRKINHATKYWPAFLQDQYREAVKGTPLLPRDLMVQVMYNRFCALILDDGRKIYPMTAVHDLSDSLDVLQQLVGGMIARGPQWWEPIPAGAPGQILTAGDEGEIPRWQDPTGGAGYYERARLVPRVADFTLDNPGGLGFVAVATDEAFGVALRAPASSGIRFLRSNIPPPPAVDWSVTMRASALSPQSITNHYHRCLILRNTANARILIFGDYNEGQLIQRWSSYTAFAANAYGPVSAFFIPALPWRRVVRNGGTLWFAVSPDGETWHEIHQEPIATYINAVDQVGIGLWVGGALCADLFQSYEMES